MASLTPEDIFDALQKLADSASDRVVPLRAPALESGAKPDVRNDAFRSALKTLSTPDNEGALDDEGIDSFVHFFETLYGDSEYRHMYSEVCEVMFGYLETENDPDEESPAQALSLANNIEIIAGAFRCQAADSAAAKGVAKLKDHIQLEQTRIKYMVRQNKWQRSSFEEMKKTHEEAEKALGELKKQIENAEQHSCETLDAAKRDYVTILGIFASIVIAFTAGSAYTSSVLANINAVGVYRLGFVVLLIGLVLLNLISLLLFFVSKISGSEDDSRMHSLAKWGNVSIGFALLMVLVARCCQWV